MIKPQAVAAVCTILLIGGALGVVSAQVAVPPAKLAAALVIKVAVFEKGISSGGDLTFYVLDSPAVAEELRKGIGEKIGGATLRNVISSDQLPSAVPSLLYIGDGSKLADALAYTRANGVLSIAGGSELVSRGVTFGVGVGDDGKPKLMINMDSARLEKLDWNPAIFKIAQTVK